MTALICIVIIETIIILICAYKLRRTKYDGNMVVMDTEDKKVYSLEIKTDPDRLDQKKQIVLKVTAAPE